jgi:hypothetical protein
VTNSFSMSGTQLSGRRYMRYFAYWPALFHEAPLSRVLVMCYGVGTTVGAVTDIASVRSIDVVETSRDVVAMSDVIYPEDRRPLQDPRVRLRIEDGRNFLETTRDRFDLITGEPPPPLTPGTVTLYTREFFQLAHDRLSEHGIVTYWLPVARRREYDVRPIIRAFCDVFTDCSLWNGTPLDWMLVGARDSLETVTESHVSTMWHEPGFSSRLREVGFEIPEQIGTTFLGDATYLGNMAAGVSPLTDNYPQRLQPRPSRLALVDAAEPDQRDVEFVAQVIDPARARDRLIRSEFVRRVWPESLSHRTLAFFDSQNVVNRILWEGANPLRHIEDVHRLLTRSSFQELPLWALGSDDVQQRAAAGGDDGSYLVAYVRGVGALAGRRYQAAAAAFADAEGRGLRTATSRPLIVYALCLAGELDAARKLAQGELPTDPDRRHFWTWLADTFGVGPAASPF